MTAEQRPTGPAGPSPTGPAGPGPTGPAGPRPDPDPGFAPLAALVADVERLADFDQLVRVLQLLDATHLTAFADFPAERIRVSESLRFLRRAVHALADAAAIALLASGPGRLVVEFAAHLT